MWNNFSREQKEEWRKRKGELERDWKEWLFREYGVENNPKREKCFDIAWEEGRSNGYYEVDVYFSRYVELIK